MAWAGFDAGLFAAMAATGWGAWRHARWVQTGAIATATLLIVDVWFDMVTASGGALAVAIVEAVLVELPWRCSRCTSHGTLPWPVQGGLATARAAP